MTRKKNENLTKSEALALSWKNRADYKGYDKSKGSAYNSWRSILYTAKGRDIGFPESWRSFEVFMSDVSGEWSTGKIVCRFDKSQPYSAANAFWGDKGSENLGKLVKLEYEGVEKTLLEWCAELGLNYNGVRQRYFKGKGFTPKEVLFGKAKKIRAKKDRDSDFRTRRMLGAYKLNDKKRGLTCDVTLEFFRNTISCGCFYCGDMDRVGLDRINNDRGHTKDNVVACCYSCNTARNNNFTFDEMKTIGAAIREVKRKRNETD